MNEEVSPAMFVYSIGMFEGQSAIDLLPLSLLLVFCMNGHVRTYMFIAI